MGIGPDGSGVRIRKPDPNAPRETYQQREARERAAHAQNIREHEARQAEFQKEQDERQQKMAARHEDKALRPSRQTKRARTETREDLEALSMNALQALAEERKVVVTNPDGHEPTRDDYVSALSRGAPK